MDALHGLKILDFSTLLPGPFATLTLADLGADVLTVTAPGKPDIVTLWGPKLPGTESSAAAAWIDRNKRSIILNLKKPEAAEAVKKLITEEGYNIILEQFRPGVMKKFGLDYDSLKEICPELIYCSLTGYGQTGPRASRAGHDMNFLALSGNMAAAGRKSTGPALSNMQISDVGGGSLYTIIGILAAVHYRDMTGEGQYVDVSMYDGVIPFNGMDGAVYLAGGREPVRDEERLNGGGMYDFYETADGRYLSIASLEPKFFRALCETLNLPEYADQKILATPEGEAFFKAKLKEIIITRPLKEWVELFDKTDACVEPVLTFAEVAADPHATARGAVVDVPVPGTDYSVRQMGTAVKLSKCPPVYRHAGYPKGSQTEEVLSALGYTEEEIRELSR